MNIREEFQRRALSLDELIEEGQDITGYSLSAMEQDQVVMIFNKVHTSESLIARFSRGDVLRMKREVEESSDVFSLRTGMQEIAELCLIQASFPRTTAKSLTRITAFRWRYLISVGKDCYHFLSVHGRPRGAGGICRQLEKKFERIVEIFWATQKIHEIDSLDDLIYDSLVNPTPLVVNTLHRNNILPFRHQ